VAGICATPIKGTHLRVVKVDACGIPVTGAAALCLVTKGFVQVNQEPDYEAGQEFLEKNADGELCVNQKDKPLLKRMKLTVDFCEVDPVLAAYALDARLLDTVSPAVTGTGFAFMEGANDNRFSMEVWQRVAGSGACDASGLQRYIYNAWPNTGNAQVGAYSIQNGKATLQFVAETQAAANQWGHGPGATSWLPTGRVVNETGLDHWLWNITTVPLPTAACGPTALT
jgi:hypothetical protein